MGGMAPKAPLESPMILHMFLAGKFKPLKEHREHISVKAQ